MTKFCMSVDIQQIITCATFCDGRLRGLGVATGRISRYPVDLRSIVGLPRPSVRSIARMTLCSASF